MKLVLAPALVLCLALPAAAQPARPMDDIMKNALAATKAAQPPAAPKSLSFKLNGKVKSPASFSMAGLKAMPAVTVETNFADQGKASWKGVSLMGILDKAGTVEEKGHGAYLQHMILARGTDDYAAGIAIGELDAKFEGKTVIIAYEKDGKPLDSLRLIVPGDAHAGRGVRDLAEITLD